MFALPRILLPVDFSERSIGAAQYARALAGHFHSEIHIVHVVDLRVYGMYGLVNDEFDAVASTPSSQTQPREQMDGFLADVLRDVTVKRVLRYGDPAHEMVKYADSEKVDLIVMPTHGYGPFRKFLLGSVTAKVLHDAHCPVWTGVHMESNPQNESVSFGRILCAIDPWNGDYNALAWAWKFASEIGRPVRIVHALPPIYAPDSVDANDDMKKRMSDEIEAEIRKAQQSVGSKAEVQIVTGDAPKAVCAAARDWNADLMVISRGAASEFLGRLGSRSYSIIRESPCPVVSV
jgi:nucleotide-binding universal stress UspA family protein